MVPSAVSTTLAFMVVAPPESNVAKETFYDNLFKAAVSEAVAEVMPEVNGNTALNICVKESATEAALNSSSAGKTGWEEWGVVVFVGLVLILVLATFFYCMSNRKRGAKATPGAKKRRGVNLDQATARRYSSIAPASQASVADEQALNTPMVHPRTNLAASVTPPPIVPTVAAPLLMATSVVRPDIYHQPGIAGIVTRYPTTPLQPFGMPQPFRSYSP
jgi:hypothetical protein